MENRSIEEDRRHCRKLGEGKKQKCAGTVEVAAIGIMQQSPIV